jgi:hypothetical protein
MEGEHFVPGRGGIAPRWGYSPLGHGWDCLDKRES